MSSCMPRHRNTVSGSRRERDAGAVWNGRVVFSTSFKRGLSKRMWYLIEDFFEQGLVVKLFLAVGWLAVVIMIASLIDLLLF